jgi:molecular chaperone GrpE (heat shock protein)
MSDKKSKKIEPEIAVAQAPPEDWQAKYLRALADYHNLVKQTASEKTEFYDMAFRHFIEELLPIYDNLKMSVSSLKEEDHQSPWVEGVKYVIKQFSDFLASHGVVEIKTIGEKFDHDTMEALEGQGETVVKEIKAGYKLNDKVIRAAKVIVN